MLTDRQLKKLSANPPSSPKRYPDGNGSGFGAQVTPSGTVTFYLQYRIKGKRKFPKIGKYPHITLREAREIASEWRKLVERGVDPIEHRQNLEKEAADRAERERARLTVSDACRKFIVYRIAGLASQRAVEAYFYRDIIPQIGNIKLEDLTKGDCRQVVERKAANHPNMASKILGTLKQFLAWCEDQGSIKVNPAAGLKPKNINVAGTPHPLKIVIRERVLSDEEIFVFWNGLEESRLDVNTQLALKMILVTGARPGEVLGLRSSEIIGNWWTIPPERRGKTKDAHAVYMSDLAMSLVNRARNEIKAVISGLADMERFPVFGRGIKARPVGSLSQAVRREHQQVGESAVNPSITGPSRFVVPASSMADAWRPHDLRRTCRTRLSAIGISNEVAEAVIGHKKTRIVQIYNQYNYDKEKKEAMCRWADEIKKITNMRER